MIKLRTFIAEFRIIGQYQKTMCKILRNKELLLVLFRQKHSIPLAEVLEPSGRISTATS